MIMSYLYFLNFDIIHPIHLGNSHEFFMWGIDIGDSL